MLNKSGTTTETFGNSTQILSDVGNQSAIGCVVDAALGVLAGNKKIAKAGTPVSIGLQPIDTRLVP